MDAVTLYAIITLANGDMETKAVRMPAAECARLTASLQKVHALAWCRGPNVMVIAR
jgi:hypothetical protein